MIRNFMKIIVFLTILKSCLCNIDIDSPNINSFNNLINAINILKNVKTHNIFETNDIFDKQYLRTVDIEEELDKEMEQLKLPRQILPKFHNSPALKKALRHTSGSDDERNDDNNKSDSSEDKNKDNLRFFDCEYGRSQCVKACKEAYREACDLEECERRLRRRLRKYCKRYTAKSRHYQDINPVPNSVNVRSYFANLLKSLVDLNEQRVKTLSQLYLLNKIDFGKVLRSDKDIDYDEIIMSIASIMSLLANNDEIKYLKDSEKPMQNNIKIARAGETNNYEKRSDNNYDGKKNVTTAGFLSCGRPLLRCVWSCYDALERACRSDDCTTEFEEEMEHACRSACFRRFYD